MAIEADYLIDRRRLKRRLAVWQVIGALALVAAALALANHFEPLREEPHVARLSVAGLIVDDPDRNEAIDRVAMDDNALALIVHINSPGGTVVGGENLYARLREVAAVKPVVAVIGEIGTSAAYMTAIATDRIFARPGSLTGSIGVILQTADVTSLLEKIGIKPETIKSSPLKAQPNPLEPFTPAAREAARALIMNMYNSFVAMVGERRHLSTTQLTPLADGRAFTGLQAVSNGLIDAIGGEREARQWLAQTHHIDADLPVRDVDIGSVSRSWFDAMASLFGKSLFSERLTLDGLLSLWQPARS